MKKAVSVTELLNGNIKRKNRQEVSEEVSVDEDDEITVQSNEFSREHMSLPLKYEEESNMVPKKPSEGKQSVQGFLMNRKSKQEPEPEVISLDNEDDEYMLAERKVTYPSSFKKTSLKDLFNNFKQPEVKSDKESSVQTNDTQVFSGPLRRCHEISKLQDLEAPLPSQKSVQCDSAIEYSPLDLPRTKSLDYHSPQIDPKEYASLRSQVDLPKSTYATMIADGFKDSSIWIQYNKPETLQQVMLETSMKKGVYEWIENAFIKLRNHTSRSKLLMKKQALEEVDRLDDFIVKDDLEEAEVPSIEFVPLMILHGDGIGKSTLIEVIMQIMGGQIYEINTSNNRGKKDILDNLLEFSTTHYVKGQGSKGIILLDDVDVIFKEHDKFFWGAVEKLLWQSRRPVVLICRDLRLVPNNLVQVAQQEHSIFHAKRVSVRTTVNFLKRFCTKHGIVPNDAILSHLATVTRRDIRKSLMALQFYSQPPGNFFLGEQEQHSDDNLSLEEIVHYSDILSHSDILSSNCQWKSAILQDKDLTFASYESRSILDSIPDDQERLRHDYMIDNKMHLVDDTRHPLLPFELDVGSYMENNLLRYYKGPNLVQNIRSRKFDRIKEASVVFLSSRIAKKDSSINNVTRKTRNSKKLRQILEDFQGNYPKTTIDDSLKFNFDATKRDQLGELINPYVLKVAQSDWNKRQINKRLFKQAVIGLSEGEYFNAVGQLSQDDMFKHPHFETDPNLVIDSWK